jgi:hypothetical protein
MDGIKTPGMMLEFDDDVQLALRLFELAVLPESLRKTFVQAVSNYAIEGEDGFALRSEALQKMFKPAEWQRVKRRVRTELVRKLADVRRFWESNYDRAQTPEDYMDELRNIFTSLEVLFPNDAAVSRTVSLERNILDDWIAKHQADSEIDPGPPPRLTNEPSATPERDPEARSIFDDVDA